jgi:hypothetical protein
MSDIIGTDDPFNERDKAALQEILGYMIPAEGDRPSANDPLIFADFLVTARPSAEVILKLLKIAENVSLPALSQMKTAEVAALTSFVVQCYYRDDRVMAALNMEPRPPHPVGFELEDSDWSLLEPVRARGKIYRDTP